MAKHPFTFNQRKARVVTLRIDHGMQFKAIAAELGCTARWAQYVMEQYLAPARAVQQPPPGPSFTHRWGRRRPLPERFGQPCRIVNPEAYHFGPASQVTVEFPDGVREVVKLGDLRRIEPMAKWRATAEVRRGNPRGGR